MKNSKQCPKCNSTDIYRVVSFDDTLDLHRYICGECCYTEEYLSNKNKFEKFKKTKYCQKIV